MVAPSRQAAATAATGDPTGTSTETPERLTAVVHSPRITHNQRGCSPASAVAGSQVHRRPPAVAWSPAGAGPSPGSLARERDEPAVPPRATARRHRALARAPTGGTSARPAGPAPHRRPTRAARTPHAGRPSQPLPASGSGNEVKNCHGGVAPHSSPMKSHRRVRQRQQQRRRRRRPGRGRRAATSRSPSARLPTWSWVCIATTNRHGSARRPVDRPSVRTPAERRPRPSCRNPRSSVCATAATDDEVGVVPLLLAGEQPVQRVVDVVVPLRGQAEPAARRARGDRRAGRCASVLRDQGERPAELGRQRVARRRPAPRGTSPPARRAARAPRPAAARRGGSRVIQPQRAGTSRTARTSSEPGPSRFIASPHGVRCASVENGPKRSQWSPLGPRWFCTTSSSTAEPARVRRVDETAQRVRAAVRLVHRVERDAVVPPAVRARRTPRAASARRGVTPRSTQVRRAASAAASRVPLARERPDVQLVDDAARPPAPAGPAASAQAYVRRVPGPRRPVDAARQPACHAGRAPARRRRAGAGSRRRGEPRRPRRRTSPAAPGRAAAVRARRPRRRPPGPTATSTSRGARGPHLDAHVSRPRGRAGPPASPAGRRRASTPSGRRRARDR